MVINEADSHKVRGCIVDGIFYPDTKKELESNLKDLFTKAGNERGKAFAILSPHAGFNYSGVFSARAFLAAADRSIQRAVILAPIHRDPVNGIILPESEYFSTPLGEIPVDTESVARLLESDSVFIRDDIPHLDEHCIEVQLPFLQHLFPNVSIVPILLGNVSGPDLSKLSAVLTSVFSSSFDETLFIISTNLTTYMNYDKGQEEANLVLELIRKRDWKGILAAKKSKKINTCGAELIAALLAFEFPDLSVSILSTGDSSSGNGDKKNGVHYASAALYAGTV